MKAYLRLWSSFVSFSVIFPKEEKKKCISEVIGSIAKYYFLYGLPSSAAEEELGMKGMFPPWDDTELKAGICCSFDIVKGNKRWAEVPELPSEASS